MITSPDNLKVGTYFAIITSNPINLKPLGFGTDKMRRDAWMKIREEDNKMNPARSDSQDMYEEHDFLVFRLYKLNLCIVVLQNEELTARLSEDKGMPYPKDIQSAGVSGVLMMNGITGERRRALAQIADLIKGTRRQLDDMKKTLEDKPRITKKDCYRELSMIAKHFPVTADSSLTEYRGAQANYIDYINSLKHGNPDN